MTYSLNIRQPRGCETKLFCSGFGLKMNLFKSKIINVGNNEIELVDKSVMKSKYLGIIHVNSTEALVLDGQLIED